jgi:hypothetical protein
LPAGNIFLGNIFQLEDGSKNRFGGMSDCIYSRLFQIVSIPDYPRPFQIIPAHTQAPKAVLAGGKMLPLSIF